MNDVTRILNAVAAGDRQAANDLLPLLYGELRRLAAQKMTHETPGQTLQATALVHEAYVRLVGDGDAKRWENRGHFYSAAAEAMRRILIEKARQKKNLKGGGEFRRVDLEDLPSVSSESEDDLLALDEAMQRLTVVDPGKAELVKLRYFAGLTNEQAAQVLGISVATAERHWAYAKAWLHCEVTRTS